MKIHKKRWIQSGISLLCSCAVVLSVFPSFADEDVSSLEGQSSTLRSELSGINEEILALNEEMQSAQMQIEILDGEIARSEDALALAEKDQEKQYSDMKNRIRYMYENGNATLLEMLFSAENMTDFLNKADFIENLSEYDRNAFEDLKQVSQDIEDQKNILEQQQVSLTDLQNDLIARKSELQKKADATATNLEEVSRKLNEARQAEALRAQQAASGGNSIVTGGAVSASASDVTLLAAILQCEAAQDYNSLLAVATVIMNRVQSPRFPNTISGVIYAKGQFEPVWTGRLDRVLKNGPTSLSIQVAQDAINGSRLASVSHCYYFLYAPSTNRDGVVIGNNLFFPSW